MGRASFLCVHRMNAWLVACACSSNLNSSPMFVLVYFDCIVIERLSITKQFAFQYILKANSQLHKVVIILTTAICHLLSKCTK